MELNSVQELNESDFAQTVSKGLTVVDFWAPWCGPCRMMAPVLDELAQRNNELAIAKVNVDENPALAVQFSVQAIPLLVFVKDGQEVERFVGMQSVESLSDAIKKHVG